MSIVHSAHGHADRSDAGGTALLLIQLGTPDQPTAGAVRRYLREFLSDPRVIEIPRLLWLPILHGFVLPLRPARSARKYRLIWSAQGSPLAVHTSRQARLLGAALDAMGQHVEVAFAMRYGNPSIDSVLHALRERKLERLLVLPLYPQFAGSTTASAFDALAGAFAHWRDLPGLRLVRDFHDDPGYLDALAERVRAAWAQDGRGERLVMSFHGLPQRSAELGDPYPTQCLATARLLAARLGLQEGQWLATFQSRFGRAQWLQPYTAPTLRDLAQSGVRSVDLICPGFVADCLETLEEIAIEARRDFLDAGGAQFRFIECLNDSPAFIEALARLAARHLCGWLRS